ncbi:MAG: putative hydro-lyase [Sporomusaceae bacterium]|nr:putative hydro-lyase [Sporomusaceae bacterium]
MNNLSAMCPKDVRRLIREGKLVRPTAGMSQGYAQANLVILPKELAYDFLLFAQRNPKPCPILDVTEIGSPEPKLVGAGADLRYDIAKYRVYKKGVLAEEVLDLETHWTKDMVAFLLGCSFSFETAMLKNNIPVRHIEENCNVPMYITNIECKPAGMFSGPTVVSMRPIPEQMVVRAVQVTSRFPAVHGAPLHIGCPSSIGIGDITKPDFGDAVTIKPGEVPVFWACGVTPQAVAMKVRPELMITHAPGYMFICDTRDEEYSVL